IDAVADRRPDTPEIDSLRLVTEQGRCPRQVAHVPPIATCEQGYPHESPSVEKTTRAGKAALPGSHGMCPSRIALLVLRLGLVLHLGFVLGWVHFVLGW